MLLQSRPPIAMIVVFASFGLAAVEFAKSVPPGSVLSQASPAPATNAATMDSAETERQLVALYEQVSPAVVRIESTDGKALSRSAGVIVSEEGHVLTGNFPAKHALTFHLPDGRRAAGAALGWSKEWGVALAKLDGPGPWPFVRIAEPSQLRAGQLIVTLAFGPPRSMNATTSLLDVEWANPLAAGQWFMTPETEKLQWKEGGVAFDLDGKLIGFRCGGYPNHGAIYTHVNVIRSIWEDLLAGKNVDQVRLGGPMGQLPGTDSAKTVPIPNEAEQKAVAASVQIRRKKGEKGFSGTIVSEDGLVATCAHHFVVPGTKVVVSVPDGRDLAGEIVGVNVPCDLGLVRITDSGPFPWVEMGDSTRLLPGDPCLAVGYGPVDAQARRPRVRRAFVAEAPDGAWSCILYSNAKMVGGDSGGGIFNADGHLVATHSQISPLSADSRVELLRKHWDAVRTPPEYTNASPLAALEESIKPPANRTKAAVVQLLDGDKPVAQGTIVSPDGRLLTKASVVPQHPACLLSDGRVLPASVVKTVREHDLAVLKIEAVDLPVVEWSKTANLPVGTMIGLAATASSIGFISHAESTFPAERGSLRATFRDGETGPEVERVIEMPDYPQSLRKGDIILSIDRRPTPNRKELLALLNTGIADDVLHLVVMRQGKQVEFDVSFTSPNPRLAGQSIRRSGFARVFGVAARPGSNLCGGPVFDREGRTIGVIIASRENGWLLVVPASIVKGISVN